VITSQPQNNYVSLALLKIKQTIMKKILAVLSLVSFLAVNISVAQTPQPATAKTETKKETTVAKTDDKSAAHSCCKGGSKKNCTAEQMKNCTPAEKAACNHGDKSKADAGGMDKKEGTKANNN
jgi:hypothetical protein